MPRSALFVIDIQGENAIDPATRIPHAERVRAAGGQILAAARGIIDSFRDRGAQAPSLVVFVQHEDETMVRGSAPWELVFAPREGVAEEMLVAKTTRNTFETNQGLAEKLKSEGVVEVVTFGIQSECCVLETSKGALDLGFTVTLLQGAHSTYDGDSDTTPPKKSAADIERDVEEALRQKGASVVPWEDAIASWEQRRMVSSYPIFAEL